MLPVISLLHVEFTILNTLKGFIAVGKDGLERFVLLQCLQD